MPRKPRPVAPATTYHVVIRCNNGEFKISDRKDFIDLLSVIARYKAKYKFKLFGYCLMNSHAHLVIQTPDDEKSSISNIMHDISWRYAKESNKRHGRKGHYFNERFKSPVVEADSHGIALLRYIYQNPVRAKMVRRARDWEFSSYRVYEDGTDDALVDIMPSFLGLAANRKRCAVHLRELVEGTLMNRDEGWTRNYAIGTERFIKNTLNRFTSGFVEPASP